MDKITEIIPDDFPVWAKDAFDEGQFFRVSVAKVEALEQEVGRLKDNYKYGLSNVARFNMLQAENERLRGALADCANEFNWWYSYREKDYKTQWCISADHGFVTAKNALAHKQGE